MHGSRLTAKAQRFIGFAVEGLRQAQSTISYCEIRVQLLRDRLLMKKSDQERIGVVPMARSGKSMLELMVL